MNAQAIVEVENLSYIYPPPRRGGQPHTALQGVSFSVEKGEIFGLLGPNGGGKTTLFKILSTLLRPSSGHVRIEGLDPVTHSDATGWLCFTAGRLWLWARRSN